MDYFSCLYAVWFSGVQDEKLLVGGCTASVSESSKPTCEVVNDDSVDRCDRLMKSDSEASLAHLSVQDRLVPDDCVGGESDMQILGSAAAKDTNKFASEKIESKKLMDKETEKRERSELWNDHRNSEGFESVCEDADTAAVDVKSAKQDGIEASAECRGSPSHDELAVNNVYDSDGAADSSGPRDNGPACIDLTRVCLAVVIQIHHTQQFNGHFLGWPLVLCLTLLVGHQEKHLACKTLSDKVLA